jgi:hypothetical protein
MFSIITCTTSSSTSSEVNGLKIAIESTADLLIYLALAAPPRPAVGVPLVEEIESTDMYEEHMISRHATNTTHSLCV